MQLIQENKAKFNVWLITKNTNDMTKFIKRYPKIRQQLKKQTEYDTMINAIIKGALDQVLFNWLRHGWSNRWNPTGNVLFLDIPVEILDHREMEQVRLEFDLHVNYAQTERQANLEKPVPEFLHDGIPHYWPSHFAWLMLHQSGMHEEAKSYEVAALNAFTFRPEILQLYREKLPKVMRHVVTLAAN